MKFPTLFTKTPKYKRFEFLTRYYDPQAEELKLREDRIRNELEAEKRSVQKNGDYRARLVGSFRQARSKSANSMKEQSMTILLRLGLLLYMVLLVLAYSQWGNVALYSLALFLPLYYFLKFRKTSNEK